MKGDPVGYPYYDVSPSVLFSTGQKVSINDFDPSNVDGTSSTANIHPTITLYRRIEDGYTADGTESIIPYHYVTSFGYNCAEKITATTDPRGNTTRFTYIPWTGTLLTMTNAQGHQTIYGNYDTSGNPGLITDPNGNQTAFTYVTSPTGWQVSTMTQKGAGPGGTDLTTSFQYTAGDLTAIQLPKGNWIVYGWQTTVTPHRLLSISRRATRTGPNLESMSYQYDSAGNRTREEVRDATNTLRRFQDFAYDTKNRLWKVFNPTNPAQFTQFGYEEGFGQRTSITDEQGRVTSFTYTTVTPPGQTAAPFLKQVQDPLSGVTQYVPDLQGNLTKMTDATTASTVYQFDDMGRLVIATSPDTGQTRYWYDPNGNLLGKVDARGVRVEYSYDPLNRLTQIQETTGTPQVLVSYFYDGANPHTITVTNGIGRLTGMQDQSGKTTWSYDTRGNIITETRTIGSQTFIIQYSWDANGNLASITYPSGRVVSYQYDSVNVDRVASVISGTTTLASSLQWEPFGDVKSMTYGNGVTESISRDYRGQVRQIALTSGATTLLDRYYSLDPTGNILGWTEMQAGGSSQTFTFDGLNRILSALGSYGEMGWSYDSVGNRLTEGTTNKALNTYFYAGNRLTATSDPPSRLKLPPGQVESQYRHALNEMRDIVKDAEGQPLVSALFGILRPLGDFFTETGVNPGPYFDTVTQDPEIATILQRLTARLTAQGRFAVVTAQDQEDLKTLLQRLEKYNIIQIASLPRDTAFSYDASGDIVSNGTGQAHYDALGRMVSVTTTASGSEAPVGDYAYDGQNRRVSKKSVSEHTYFVYDLAGNLIAEWDPDFTGYLREYVYLGSRPLVQFAIPTVGGVPGVFPGCTPPHCSTVIPSLWRGEGRGNIPLSLEGRGWGEGKILPLSPWGRGQGEGAFLAIGLFNGYILLLPVFTILVLRSKRRSLSLVFILLGFGCVLAIGITLTPPSAAQIPGETVYYYHVDYVQTPIAMTDASGNVAWSAIPAPFMGIFQENNPGNVVQPLRYPGQYHDTETGLHYNMNRYYWPSLGRYLEPDPILLPNPLISTRQFSLNRHTAEVALGQNPVPFPMYGYVDENPLIFLDPSGLTACASGKCGGDCPSGVWYGSAGLGNLGGHWGKFAYGGFLIAGALMCSDMKTSVLFASICPFGGGYTQTPHGGLGVGGMPFIRCSGYRCKENLNGWTSGGFLQVGPIGGFGELGGGSGCVGIFGEAGSGLGAGGFRCKTIVQ